MSKLHIVSNTQLSSLACGPSKEAFCSQSFYNLEAKARAYLVAQLVKKPTAIWKTASNAGESGPIPGWERSLEKAFLENPMDREDWRVHSMGSQD